MVVLTIIGLMLTIAVPRYFHSVNKARDATLQHDLSTLREAIDRFYGDNGRYPDALDELVTKKYLRAVPVDPITGSAETWVLVAPEDQAPGKVYDVKSGAQGTAYDGSHYVDW